jgi:hypothetical protein
MSEGQIRPPLARTEPFPYSMPFSFCVPSARVRASRRSFDQTGPGPSAEARQIRQPDLIDTMQRDAYPAEEASRPGNR